MTNNRLQMLVRIYMHTYNDKNKDESSGEILHPKTVDEIATEFRDLCAEEFIYDAIAEMRHDRQIDIIAIGPNRVPVFTEMGRRVLDFDLKIMQKIIDSKLALQIVREDVTDALLSE